MEENSLIVPLAEVVTQEILKFSNTSVSAIDRDKKILAKANELEKQFPSRFKFYQMKFSQLDTILR